MKILFYGAGGIRSLCAVIVVAMRKHQVPAGHDSNAFKTDVWRIQRLPP